MNFDLAPIPVEKFIISTSHDNQPQPDGATRAIPRSLNNIPSEETELLKFDPLVLQDGYNSADRGDIELGTVPLNEIFQDDVTEREPLSMGQTLSSLVQIQEPPKKKKCADEVEGNVDLDWILSCISPPQEGLVDGKRFIRCVSKTPADPYDAYILERKLDRLLQDRQAYPTEVCPIRRVLYEECFNELIRQIAVSSSRERSVIFLRFREDLNRTIEAYLSLYGSTIAYTTLKESRRQVAQQRKEEKGGQVMEDAERLKAELKGLLEELAKAISIQTRELERINRKNKEEIDCLRTTNLRLKKQLADFTSGFTGRMPKNTEEGKPGVGVSESRRSTRTVRGKSNKQITEEMALIKD
jgi:dynein light intermediate chain